MNLKSEELYEKILNRDKIHKDIADFIDKNKDELLEEICVYCHIDPIENDVYIFHDGTATCKIGFNIYNIELINGAWELNESRIKEEDTLENS